jgi:hypothetical protein
VSDGVRYVLVIRSRPSNLPAEIRLRQALKYLARAVQFDCEEIREMKPPDCGTVEESKSDAVQERQEE